ncbi:MAG: aspartyl/asparaginyl beta-hydroxylase domain-containing protein [Pseudomonadota bacterium]
MRAGDEEVRMKTGELWWFDNKAEHEAMNDSETDRIHLIFDLLPEALEAEVIGEASAERTNLASVDHALGVVVQPVGGLA